MNNTADRKFQSKMNNAQGHLFESAIITACKIYEEKGIAKINKIPEPFRVMRKYAKGRFEGRFTSNAQPDFQGTLKNGKSIVFEAKFTSNDKIEKGVLSKTQENALQTHLRLGAEARVLASINDECFFIPYYIWTNMKVLYGRNYINKEDVSAYKVPFKGAVMFLENFTQELN